MKHLESLFGHDRIFCHYCFIFRLVVIYFKESATHLGDDKKGNEEFVLLEVIQHIIYANDASDYVLCHENKN